MTPVSSASIWNSYQTFAVGTTPLLVTPPVIDVPCGLSWNAPFEPKRRSR